MYPVWSMTCLSGAPLMDQVDSNLEHRNAIALNMFRAWYVPFYFFGVIHGDPHLGNYSVRDDATVNLLDFGCIRVFRPEFVGAVIDLYTALSTDDEALAVHAYETWGFENPSKEMIGVLNEWARFLYGPLLADRVQSIQETGGTAYGAGVAASVPREFVLMDRAAIGLGSVFTHLRAEINWHRMFHELIDDFDLERLRTRQTESLAQAGVPPVY
mgnify:CR=1 FL=1